LVLARGAKVEKLKLQRHGLLEHRNESEDTHSDENRENRPPLPNLRIAKLERAIEETARSHSKGTQDYKG